MDGMEKETIDIPTMEELTGDALGGETPVEEVPVTEAMVEEVPVEEVPITETPIEEVPVTETPQFGGWNEMPMNQQPQPGQWNNVYMSQPVYPGQWQEMPMASQGQPGQWHTVPQQQQPQMGQPQPGQQQYVPWNAVPPIMQNPNGQWNNVPPMYPTGGYQNPEMPKKKGSYVPLIILFVLLGLIWLGAVIFAGYNVWNKISKVDDSWAEEFGFDTEDDWYNFEDFYDDDSSEKEEEKKEANPEDSYDWKKDNEGNYVPTDNDPYYMEFVDSISEDLDYKVKKDIYEYAAEDDNVNIYIETPIIENTNIDNLDVLNKHMADTTGYLMKNYANNPEKGGVSDCEITVKSYITYMDENILSIVIDQRISMGTTADFMLSSFNIDMKTGQLLWNRQLLNYDEELAKEFRRMSDYQNGTIDYLENISDEELLNSLTAEGTSVAFYTPVGMEIGFSYNDSVNVGWVTATIKDYEKYQ